jgi:hypothetical protein
MACADCRPQRIGAEPADNERRRERAARAIAAYDGPDLGPGQRPARARDPENGEEAISELLCDLRHLADELGLGWVRLVERAERYYGEEAARHVVEVTAEGFQVRDTWTEELRADVWSTREQAQDACEELDGSVAAAGAS